MRNLISYFIKYPVAVNIILIAFFILGFLGYSNMRSSFFPLTDSRIININVTYPGSSPQEIEEGAKFSDIKLKGFVTDEDHKFSELKFTVSGNKALVATVVGGKFKVKTPNKNWNGVDTLKNIKNDTLIIWGDQDKSYNLEQVQTLEKNITNSKLVVIKNCAHNVHLEQPEHFNNTVRNFLI